ncbi:MAG: hypothetical protein WA919_06565 [Coleofasciculaceae cyanobacterium]
MTNSDKSENIASENDRSLKTLVRSLTRFRGRFSLIVVRCNYASLRDRILQEVRERCDVQIRELTLMRSDKRLYSKIVEEFGDKPTDAVMVLGLESVVALDDLLAATNQVRDKFRSFPFPVVLWVTDGVYRKLVRVIPDFKSWAGPPLQFTLPDEELQGLLRQQAEQAFADESSFTVEGDELEAIEQDLQSQGEELDPELEACLAFLWGLIDEKRHQLDTALENYLQSLAFWQQNNRLYEQGLVSLRIGLTFYHKGTESWQESKNYLQQSLDKFEAAQRTDLVAKYISQLGKVLRGLQDWESLESLAQKALRLHQNPGLPGQLAEDYGFLAEVALNKNCWDEANQWAKQALEILGNSPDIQFQNCGLYHLILAKSEQELGEIADAISNLEKAREKSQPQDNPTLYIEILAKLRSLYFEQGQYREAFHLKLEQREVESQYGLRAFIGAGRLQPARQVRDLAEATAEEQAEIAEDIVAASGRQQDVERLIERIKRREHKLTVIYGQSGVGKSSIVQAGLVPALELDYFEGRDALPILMQVYNNWLRRLGEGLGDDNVETLHATSLLEQLRQSEQRNLLTVLIFDQFEEFFFIYKDQASRRPFYEFLGQCLEIPYVKVILSLREDYLHYLLECARTTELKIIDGDILKKSVLYHLGNFLPADAKSVIRNLTERSKFYLEPDLVDELVKDLAGDVGEVRPIELQIVGAQLQTEQITTLKQYQERGSKEELVEGFLEEVVKDCGSENEKIAKLVLYLLTDENNTRPLKTRADLELELDVTEERLDLVLEVLVKSGLVLNVPAFPVERYQLVHDYLVSLVRQQGGGELLAKFKESEEKRKLTEKELNRVLKRQLLQTRLAVVAIAILAIIFGSQEAIKSTNTQIKLLNDSSATSFTANWELDALIQSLKASKLLNTWRGFWIPSDTKIETVYRLAQAVYGVRERNRLEGHENDVHSVSFSPDGRMLASASADNTIKLWSLNGEEINTLDSHNDYVWDVNFSPDGKMLASASADNTIKLWSLDGKELQTFEGHSDVVYSVSFSPDGKMLASASDDQTIKLWSIDGEELQTFQGHEEPVHKAVFSPDGKILASASDDQTVKLWNLDGKELKTIRGHNNWVLNVTFSPDGQKIASVGRSSIIKLQNLEGKHIKTISGHSNYVWGIDFSPGGQILASSSLDGTVKLWNLQGEILGTLHGDKGLVRSVSFSPDGQILASASSDHTVKLWSIDRPFKILEGHNQRVRGMSFSPDGKLIASASWDSTIKIWRRDGTLLTTINGHSNQVSDVSFSPDSKLIASASKDKTIKLWSIDGRLLKTLEGHGDGVAGVSFSPDGKLIASAGQHNTVRLWKSDDGTLLRTFQGHTDIVLRVSFSPDGKLIASASEDDTAKVWKLDGTLFKTLAGHNHDVQRVSFSPDGKLIATASPDKTVKLWTIKGKLLKTLKGHSGSVYSVSFSPNGKLIASTGRDRTVKLWSRDGTLLSTFRKDDDYFWEVNFSPDSKTIAAASEGSKVILWDLDPDELIERGCDWARDYLKNNPNVEESDITLCDNIGTQQ